MQVFDINFVLFFTVGLESKKVLNVEPYQRFFYVFSSPKNSLLFSKSGAFKIFSLSFFIENCNGHVSHTPILIYCSIRLSSSICWGYLLISTWVHFPSLEGFLAHQMESLNTLWVCFGIFRIM